MYWNKLLVMSNDGAYQTYIPNNAIPTKINPAHFRTRF